MRTLIIYLRDKAESRGLTYFKLGSPVDGSPELINVFKYVCTRPRKRLNARIYG
jgi:hypothetical protein